MKYTTINDGGGSSNRNYNNIIRVIKRRSLRWVGHIECLWKVKTHVAFWSENVKRRDHVGYFGVNESILLN